MILGGTFFVLGGLGSLVILTTPDYKMSNSFFEHFITFFVSALMIVSGYILIGAKKKKRPKLGWATIIFGTIQLFSIVESLWSTSNIRPSIIALYLGLFIGELAILLMFLSGMALRKIN